MTARRIYMLEQGPWCEVQKHIVCEWLDADYRRAKLHEEPPGSSWRFLSEEDLLCLEGGREALEAWRREDDSVAAREEEDFERQRKQDAEWDIETRRIDRLARKLIKQKQKEREK